MKNCKICDKLFTPRNHLERICSDECRKEAKYESKRKWRTRTPDHKKRWTEYTNKWRNANQRNKIISRLAVIRSRAAEGSLDFNLSVEDIIIPDICPVLGIPLDSKTRDRQWSIDRVIPELGYVQNNIQVISMRANRLKQDATVEEIEKILDYYRRNVR